MADIKKSKKEKTSVERSHRDVEEFSIQVNSTKTFNRLVSALNHELGHGNWTTKGRPVRHLRRVDKFNSFVSSHKRTYPVTFCVPAGCIFLLSKLSLIL